MFGHVSERDCRMLWLWLFVFDLCLMQRVFILLFGEFWCYLFVSGFYALFHLLK